MVVRMKVMGDDYLSKIREIFVFFTIIHLASSRILKADFSVDYFKQKNIYHIATFGCWEESGKEDENFVT